jgi:hypothetical protein
MLFVRDKRQEVKSQKPELSFGDLSMELAQMWKGLSDDGKKVGASPHIHINIRYFYKILGFASFSVGN